MIKYSFVYPYYNRKSMMKTTLDSISYFYGSRQDFEVIIVDDVSHPNHQLDELIENYKYPIKLHKLTKKTGINPCYPYNVGVRLAQGSVLILSSPETFHTANIFELAGSSSESIKFNDYLCFSVFCPTDSILTDQLSGEMNFTEKLKIIDNLKPKMHESLGSNGRPEFNNECGSWYLHSQYRNTDLNFLTAITKDLYYAVGGFREEFRNGTGFDDNDFLDRIRLHNLNIKYFDEACAIHLNHKPVHSGNPTSNLAIYNSLKGAPYNHNNSWGSL